MGKSLIRVLPALLLFALFSWATVQAQDVRTYLPTRSHALAPVLADVQTRVWPEAPEPYTLAGQVEQESCISLRHSKCWNSRAELKTSREYGFGLGQITTAYRADGSVRFNKFEELRARHASLRSWAWEDRYNADYQLQAIVEMDRLLFEDFDDSASLRDRWAFTLSAYNGGRGGVLQDKHLCSNTRGCDKLRWFGNVEGTSLKTRRVNPGYGKSAFEINREYPRLILDLRRDKYRVFWEPK